MSQEAEAAVTAAVAALYSGDPAAQAQANQWLTAFQKSHDAWQICFRLLTPGQPQELLFFAATLLVRKVKADWDRLEPPARQELGQGIRAKFEEALGWPGVPLLVLRQLCLLLAATVGSSGGEGGGEVVARAKALLGGAPAQQALALELLGALAEEAEDLDRVRRLVLVNGLLPRAREVFGWLGQLLAGALEQLAGEGQQQLAVGALRCTEAWLRLNQVAGGGSIYTPGELHVQQPQLFSGALSALAGPQRQPAVVDAAAQVLLLLFGAETFSGNSEDAERAATASTLSALVSLRHRLGPPEAEGVALGVTQLGSALAERSPEWCGGELPQAVPFSEVVLECLARPEPAVAENSLDYFLMINTVPLAERAPQLGPPLYEAQLAGLVHHVALPQHFTSWEEEGEADEDSFNRLREQILPEALETAYGLLRSAYLGFAWHLLQSAGSWQQAEAALYLFTAVSMSVKARVLAAPAAAADENASPAAPTAAAADAQQAQQLLMSLFTQLCSAEGVGKMTGAHPLLARGACSLLECYAAWFGRAAEAPLQDAFGLCLACMRSPEASGAAAKAFQALCLRCAWRLRDAAMVASLIDAATQLLQPAPAQQKGRSVLSMADKGLLVEGLARLVAGLPPHQLLEAAARLTKPFAVHATSLVRAAAGSHPSSGALAVAGCGEGSHHQLHPSGSGAALAPGAAAPSAQARQALAEDLQLVASALRFLAFGTALADGGAAAEGGGGGLAVQPVVRILEEVAEPLQAVVASSGWHGDEAVAAAAADVYRRALCSARKQGAELLPAVLPALVALFERTALPGCLDVLGDMVEIHFQEGGQLLEALMQALGSACSVAFPRLQADLREQQGLAFSLLGLADQLAVYAPALLWASPLLAPLLQLATACLALRETDAVSSALALLGHALKAHEAASEEDGVQQVHLDALAATLAARGEEMVWALLAAECDTCPRHLMRTAADCIFRLLSHPALGPHAQGWLSSALASGRLPAVAAGALTAEDCSTFCALALGGSVRGARFMALVVDFGQLARGQNTSDVLLAYQM